MRRARGDLALARAPVPEGVFLEDLAFHLQQAAEKAVKAVLIRHGIRFPKIHDIDELLALLPPAHRPGSDTHFGGLAVYAVMTRYPGPSEPVTREEFLEALAIAERAVEWAEGECVDRAAGGDEGRKCHE